MSGYPGKGGPTVEQEEWLDARGVNGSTVGDGGTATAGDRGTATAGDYGTATVGYDGTATAGHRGTATAGDRGTATVGYDGTVCVRWYDGDRYRLTIGYVGEDGIVAGIAYRCDDTAGQLVPVTA